MRAKLRQLIEKTFYVPEGEALSDEDSLLDRGIIDSTGVLELISVLEAEFGISVADEEMVPENLDSIARIEAFVAKKRTAAGAA
jgi:acyl carrier protein